MVGGVRLWQVLVALIPILIYQIYGLGFYIRTLLVSNPNYTKQPKYKRLIWKTHRLQVALNPYYIKLSKEGKRKFLSRLVYVFPRKNFQGREGESVSIEKKIIVLSALVQLTFGLKKYELPRFRFIALYPSDFYSKILDTQVRGLTFTKGHILLSWLDTLKGFHNPSDNLNLAIHEWSHALQIDHSFDQSRRMYATLNEKSEDLITYFNRVQQSSNLFPYLRSYAFTNEQEFFAVCVEHFFETPETFKKQMPEVFEILSSLLNQNPLNSGSNYAL